MTKGPFVMPSSSFALRASEDEWQKFWSKRPPPGSNDLLALVRRRALKTEGNLQIFMANLRYFKEALAKLRAGVFGMSAKFEPIVGRYMHLELFGRPHRIYVEEAGEGTPLLCLHTAGTDGRQYRGLMNDTRVTSIIASLPSTCPGMESPRRRPAGTTRSTSSPRRITPPWSSRSWPRSNWKNRS